MPALVISCSLNPESRSRVLAKEIATFFDTKPLIDLAEYTLPFCDARACYQDPQVKALTEKVEKADALVFALPIYNYSANSVCKNFLELMWEALSNKVVGFVCVAYGSKSFMSVLGLANSLMMDCNCLIVPKIVYAEDSDFTKDHILINEEITNRLKALAETVKRLSHALKRSGL